MYAKGSMLIWNDIVLVFRIQGLVLGRNIDVLLRKMSGLDEILKADK